MQKSSTVVLTADDLDKYHQGVVSDRLSSEWGLTYEDLQTLIQTNQYIVITKESNNGTD